MAGVWEAIVAAKGQVKRSSSAGEESTASVNAVRLSGRLAAAPVERVLPSGDAVLTLRLIVTRPPRRARAGSVGRSASVDTIDCSVWGVALRRRVGKWEPGDQISVEGSLRRRFWQGPGGARSRYDVEVLGASRLERAG